MTFTIVLDRVEQLATDLDALAANVDDVAHRRVAYAGFADVRAVEDGLREFFGEWTDGMDRLHQQLGGLSSHLHAAGAAYASAEQSIVDAARGSG